MVLHTLLPPPIPPLPPLRHPTRLPQLGPHHIVHLFTTSHIQRLTFLDPVLCLTPLGLETLLLPHLLGFRINTR